MTSELLFSQRKDREDPEETEQDRLTELNSITSVLFAVTVAPETDSVGEKQTVLYLPQDNKGPREENTAVVGNECYVYYGMLLLHLLLQESNIFSLKKVYMGCFQNTFTLSGNLASAFVLVFDLKMANQFN